MPRGVIAVLLPSPKTLTPPSFPVPRSLAKQRNLQEVDEGVLLISDVREVSNVHPSGGEDALHPLALHSIAMEGGEPLLKLMRIRLGCLYKVASASHTAQQPANAKAFREGSQSRRRHRWTNVYPSYRLV